MVKQREQRDAHGGTSASKPDDVTGGAHEARGADAAGDGMRHEKGASEMGAGMHRASEAGDGAGEAVGSEGAGMHRAHRSAETGASNGHPTRAVRPAPDGLLLRQPSASEASPAAAHPETLRQTHQGEAPHSGEISLSPRAFVLQCVGFGLLLMGYCGAVPQIALAFELVNGWGQVLLVQFAFVAATGIGCLAVRALLRRSSRSITRLACALGALAAIAALVAACLIAQPKAPGILVAACMFVIGLASSYPLVFWHITGCAIYRTAGQARYVASLVGSVCVAGVMSLLVAPLGIGRASLLATSLGLVIITAICPILAVRVPAIQDSIESDAHVTGERYHLTAHSASTIASLGIMMGLAGSTLVFTTGFEQAFGTLYWVMAVGRVLIYCLIAVLVTRVLRRRRVWFGMLTRVCIAVIGLVLALLPTLSTVAPDAMYILVRVLFALQSIVISLLSTEITCTNNLHSPSVMPTNYALYALAACVGALAFWAFQTLVGGHLAWDLVGVLAVVATVMVIPLLPSASSNAATFALAELPENEGREKRLARVRDGIAAGHGLTEREVEVLGLLLRGMSRQQIAEALSLSEWTVKDYISAIYGKVDVHSYQELMALARRSEQAG